MHGQISTILLRALGGTAIVLFFFFGTLVSMNHVAPLCPKGNATEFKGPFPKFGNGVAYTSSAAELDSSADTAAAPKRSIFMVCEGAYALGPAHTIHAEIIAKGKDDSRTGRALVLSFPLPTIPTLTPTVGATRPWRSKTRPFARRRGFG
jgi:hypothetical protein